MNMIDAWMKFRRDSVDLASSVVSLELLGHVSWHG